MNNTETPEKKIDTELLQVIDDAIAKSKDYVEALDKILQFKKTHRGLKGMRISVSQELAEDPDKDEKSKMNEVAHAIVIIERLRALGEIEISDEVNF